MVKIKDIVKNLDPYVPGRSIQEIGAAYGIDPQNIIKLGSNENPLGPSKKAITALKNNLKNIHRYPESDNHELISGLANYAQVSPDQIIVGGDGADEILDVLAKTLIEPGDEFIVHLPTYMYYEFIFRIHGAVPVYARWDVANNCLDLDSVLEAISDRTRIIFLCNPNNPTGGLINQEDIISVIESTEELVVVDEAYFEFSGVNQVKLLEKYENLFIIRTFSKVMGLAGLRIGYGLGDPNLIDYMYRVKPVFSLTRASQVAAMATLEDLDYIKASTELSIKSRELLYRELSKIDNIRVLSSKSNYLLMDIRETGFNSSELTEELLKKGVIVRDCKSFKGLDDYWIRVSVGTLEEDWRFLDILKEII